ncbi:hypothetical protein BL250_15460 [Erwinia sp. OLTSP20]|uniref:tyrosine-type recombinase/integrase n=1 Tax=unclassified Erwinia TaxID=2622719 RepID=UPI000C17EB19|nr:MULTISPECIES: tyrosine-type recombinase/integrase [unclassified Erwinia]PIJ48605.1 hypothetical protein BV501_16480 [Erwinia sp. OAMSP11]PIJ68959.1 hypothetical protein BK416_15720 [Erwinia sp. OLSSP12]PIJ78827.1 hypothetical protein BLD47_16535 [Erwinia sp. OLCASP19]PIJ79923.1 hypothetical protein BLD46_16370 [Erwinia sp. OLMTSP26]PIJ82041.1 hypothetical protein BLD49_15885 [Erwinia sp. OLMDSP33]
MKRKFLTEEEINLILQATSVSRNALRDDCMISLCFYHGLRVSELISLKINDYDRFSEKIYIKRLKGGFSTIHPVLPAISQKLNNWIEERKNYTDGTSDYLFLTKSGKEMSRQRFCQIIKLYASISGLLINVHPHMLRHACGYSLADRGNDTRLIQDYLGHKNIRHTVTYTAANAERFNHAWRLTAKD